MVISHFSEANLDDVASRLTSIQAQTLFAHWRAIGGASLSARREVLNPAQIYKALGEINLLYYEAAGRRLRFRLVGGNIRDKWKRDLRGVYFDECMDAGIYETVGELFLTCPEVPAIVLMQGLLYFTLEKPWIGERLLLPLFDAPEEPSGLVSTTHAIEYTLETGEPKSSLERRVRIWPAGGAGPRDWNAAER